ncbi:protein kinase [Parahaliea maris]|uniref:non-specific serine/threonine protein kinase n=1 Tax=Parahaliea maris TaxID=2716870 RepID=A0A5C8ZZG7_9GAMM|nr:serine/threonine-protein kinase [Parahaliea maris]TXS93878.1 protein kinase [Parahaliea maris]
MSTLDIPGYILLEEIGRGGMSTVFLAEQTSFGRKVALKILFSDVAETEYFGQRFLREARISASFSHPNIVSVYDTGSVEGCYFLAMEHLSGGNLRERLRSGIPLPDILGIVEAIADALDYAGSRGIVHRDIKPGNIMFREDDSLAIVDFGIARDIATETQVTQAGTILGTPHYMSPEQALGEEIDYRSDLYSLGIIFFELLSGAVPFRADSAAAVGIKHINAPIPSLPENMAAFQPIVNKILAKSANDRYQSGTEFISDLADTWQNLSTELQTTVLLSMDDGGEVSSRHSWNSQRPAAGSQRFSRHSRPSRAITGTGLPDSRKSSFAKKAASLSAVAIAAAAVTGLVLYNSQQDPDSPPTVVQPPTDTGSTPRTPYPDPVTSELDLAAAAMASGNLVSAEEHLDNATNSGSLARAQSKRLDALREALETQSAIASQREALVNTFNEQLSRQQLYLPSEDNAFGTLALMSEAGVPDQTVDAYLARVSAMSAGQVNTLLNQGKLEQAQRELNAWAAVDESPAIQSARDNLASLQLKLARQRDEQNILRKIAPLESEADSSIESNDRLLQMCTEILKESPGSQAAKQCQFSGRNRALAFAREALNAENLPRAERALKVLQKVQPAHPELASVEAELRRRQQNQARALSFVEQARESTDLLLNDNSVDLDQPVVTELLRDALAKLDQAEILMPELVEISETRQSLVGTCRSHFERLLKDGDVKAAAAFASEFQRIRPAGTEGMRLALDMENALAEGAQEKKARDYPSF